MKFYIPFGDWSNDGHGHYEKILVEAPSMEGLLKAEKAIKSKYGEDFFQGFAEEWEEPYLSETVVEALRKECNIKVNPEEPVTLEQVINYFIDLLNAFDANITVKKTLHIPMICNWTCRGFETVGYGCFD